MAVETCKDIHGCRGKGYCIGDQLRSQADYAKDPTIQPPQTRARMDAMIANFALMNEACQDKDALNQALDYARKIRDTYFPDLG